MTDDSTLPVKREQTSLARVSSQIAITNKILSGRTIVITDSMYSMYRLILDEIDRINKKVKIIYFKNVTNAFNFITSNKVHMVISGNFFPQLYGITFLIAFKSLYPKVPFILNSTIELDDIYHKNKADAFILPSSDLTDLFIVINNLIDDNKSTEKINRKIKIKDIDTMVLLDKANDILSKNTFVIKYNEFSSNALGLIYLDSGMFKKSIELFSKAIELSKYVFPEGVQ